jgi:hypothetical protein
MRALADNPKVQDLHIAIQPSVGPFRTIVWYRPMWYDAKVARKAAKEARRLAKLNPPRRYEVEGSVNGHCPTCGQLLDEP